LYNENYNKLISEYKKIKNNLKVQPANPLLIKVRQEYEDADIKVIICGQETDCWNVKLGDKRSDVKFLMNDYEAYFYNDQDFFNENEVYNDDNYSKSGGRLKKKRQRSFLNRCNFKLFEEQLKGHFKDKKVSFIWNNLSKIGKNARGKATKEIECLENNNFNVLKQELDILNPYIVIFTIGPSREHVIRNKFDANITNAISEYKVRVIGKVEIKDKDILAIRTYHPNYRKGVKAINKAVLEYIKDNF